MGSYATLYINGHETWSTKYSVDPRIMPLFQRSERSLVVGTIAEVAPSALEDDGSNADDDIELLKYETTVKTFRERLDIMGFTIEFVKSEFERRRRDRLEDYQEDDIFQEERKALQALTFDGWVKAFATLWADKDRWKIQHNAPPPTSGLVDDWCTWYVTKAAYDMPYSAFYQDVRLTLRALCEVSSPDAPVAYDLSELIYDEGDAELLVKSAEAHFDGGYARARRIIVLTEGRSDQRAIEAALALLRPSVKEYFSFLDFETLTIPGSVASVINTLKAFISVGIANRIIALLDNDTAAHTAVLSAKLGQLPDNVRVVFLPTLPIAKDYPTLGPTGMSNMDINGLACSIELFFGGDVLRKCNELVPIQWKGYDDKLARYQGEIMHKGELQACFWDKLTKARKEPDTIARQDWTGMELIVQSLVSAFYDMPPIDYVLEAMDDDAF